MDLVGENQLKLRLGQTVGSRLKEEKGSSVSGCGSRCCHTNPKRQRGRRAYVLQRLRSRFGLMCAQKPRSQEK